MLPGTTDLANGRYPRAPRSLSFRHIIGERLEHHAASSFNVNCTYSRNPEPEVFLEGCPQTALHKPIHRGAGSPMGLGVADFKALVALCKCHDTESLTAERADAIHKRRQHSKDFSIHFNPKQPRWLSASMPKHRLPCRSSKVQRYLIGSRQQPSASTHGSAVFEALVA